MRRSRQPLLHVAPFLWSGAGSVITRLCESQRSRYRVVVVTGGRQGGLGDWPVYRRRLGRAGVELHDIDFFHRESDRFWTGVERLTTLVRELKPVAIHAHAGVPSCAAAIARSMSGVRTRVIGQMYSWGPDRPAWMNHQDVWGLAQTDRVVCSADAYWDLLVDLGVPERKLTYLPWGLPLEALPWRERTRLRPSAPVVGFVGRIEPRKGQLDLVRALPRLRTSYPGATLVLTGPIADADYAARITTTVRRLGLGDAVTMTGYVKDPVRHVARWDAFASMSSDEGQGLAVLEAMALGVPVAARRVAGVADFLTHGRTGVAIPSRRPADVASAIERALAGPASATIARRARQMVERRYAWPQTVDAFDRLYGR